MQWAVLSEAELFCSFYPHMGNAMDIKFETLSFRTDLVSTISKLNLMCIATRLHILGGLVQALSRRVLPHRVRRGVAEPVPLAQLDVVF